MKNIFIAILTLVTLSLNASTYSMDRFNYEFINENKEFPDQTVVKIAFELEVHDIIRVLEKQIVFAEIYVDNLLLKTTSTQSSFHNDLLLIEIRDVLCEIQSLKDVLHRMEYYLVVANGSLLE